jgi:hypothetical protein
MHVGSGRTRTQDRPLQYKLAMIIGALLGRDNSGLLVTRWAVEGRRHEGASSPGSSPYFLAVRGLVRQSVDVSSGARSGGHVYVALRHSVSVLKPSDGLEAGDERCPSARHTIARSAGRGRLLMGLAGRKNMEPPL